jgi:hypothetical protein
MRNRDLKLLIIGSVGIGISTAICAQRALKETGCEIIVIDDLNFDKDFQAERFKLTDLPKIDFKSPLGKYKQQELQNQFTSPIDAIKPKGKRNNIKNHKK